MPSRAHSRLVLGMIAVLGVVGCQKTEKPAESLGSMSLGAVPDPAFDDSWRKLAARPGAEAEVFYIEDDRGEGLMGRVRRAGKQLPKPAPPPEPEPAAAVQPTGTSDPPELPSGDEVSAVVRSNLPLVKGCYLRMSREGKVVSGRAIVSFTVAKDGAVQNVRVDAPAFRETALPRCVAQQVARWAFPKSSKGGLDVSYPFVFVGG